tara:strand:+ start:2028 stop:3338 length:1311 start_codon:yes stop_codon:yes gene_type:complete
VYFYYGKEVEMREPTQYKSNKSVSKTGKVSWRPRWAVWDENGQKTIKFGKSQPTKAQADRISAKAVEDLKVRDSLQLVSEEDAMTVGQFAEAYWLKAERQVKVKNKAQIRTVMKYWKEIGLWDIKLEDLTTAMMYKYIKRLADRGLQPATIQNYKTELRTLLDLAIVMGQIDRNVLNGVKNERRTQEQMENSDRIFEDIRKNTWTIDEINENLEKLRHIPRLSVKVQPKNRSAYIQERSATGNVPEILWYGRYLIGFHLGLRTGEIHALKFNDFDFVNNQVLINKAIANVSIVDQNNNYIGYSQEESKVKRSSQRVQMLTDQVIEFVKELAVIQDMLGIYAEDQYLFVNDRGIRLDLGYFRKHSLRIQEHCGIVNPLASPKYTRHSSATVLASLGWSSVDIANHLGHKNDRVTREYYIKDNLDLKKKMAQEFNKKQ